MEMHGLREIECELVEHIVRWLQGNGWSEAPWRPRLMIKEANQNLLLCIRINTSIAVSLKSVRVEPALAVRHCEIEELDRDFFGLPRGGGKGETTFGLNLSDVLPGSVDVLTYAAKHGKSLSEVQCAVLSDLERYGLPFLESFRSIGDVVRHIESRAGSQDQFQKLAIAYALIGEMDEARSQVRRILAEVRTQQPPLSDQTWTWLRRYVSYFQFDEAWLSEE